MVVILNKIPSAAAATTTAEAGLMKYSALSRGRCEVNEMTEIVPLMAEAILLEHQLGGMSACGKGRGGGGSGSERVDGGRVAGVGAVASSSAARGRGRGRRR